MQPYPIKQETCKLIPERTARRFRVLPLLDREEEIIVGMVDPSDLMAFDEVSRLLKKAIQVVLVAESALLRAIDLVYRHTDDIDEFAEALGKEVSRSRVDLETIVQAETLADAPVVRILQTLFEDAVRMNASDIHIEPDESVIRIRQRVDGMLHENIIKEKQIAPALISKLKLMSGLEISEKRLPQDGRFDMMVKGQKVDVRIATMPVHDGESVVMRLLNQSTGILDLSASGMPKTVLTRFRKMMRRPYGMILVTGPTSSGKTTTLYGALQELNQPSRKIITAEDPVEYRLPRINQVQVHAKVGLTFPVVLRTALRQDPDVILVGEMRDQETVEIAIRAALTGHLVFSTLHTNDAIGTAVRLLEMGAKGLETA